MMNKKGGLVLRDMVFMMMIVSGIFVFAGFFVSDMATNYENNNMSSEWMGSKTSDLSNSTFYVTAQNVSDTGDGLSSESSGFWLPLIEGTANTLKGIGNALIMVFFAPNTIADLISGTLIDMDVSKQLADIIAFLIKTILWGIIIFTVSSAFLRGGRV